jgi:trigger factor
MEALIPLPPKVTLGDITGLKLAHTIYEPTSEAIEKQLKAWHEERAEFEELTGKSAEIGDIIRVNVLLYEGSPPEDRQPETVFWEIGKNHPDLDAQLIGVTEGERKIIVITDPGRGDSNQAASRTLIYSVEILKVGRRKLPELSDAYLEGLGIEGGLPRLRTLIEEDMRRVLEGMADAELRSQAIRKAAALSTVSFPQAMIQREIYRNLLNIKKEAEKHRMGLRQFFQAAGKDIAEYERETAAAADERIRIGLLLGEIAEQYNIRVSEDELRSECVKLGERQKLPGDVLYERMKATGAIAEIEDQLLYRRITDFLIERAEVERTTKPLSEAAKEGEAEQAIG